MFGFGEVAFRDQGEIGDVLLILPAPRGRALAARMGLQRNAAQVPLLGNALLKPRETDTKNRSQYAVAGCKHTLSRQAQSRTMALRAIVHSESQRLRTGPLHF